MSTDRDQKTSDGERVPRIVDSRIVFETPYFSVVARQLPAEIDPDPYYVLDLPDYVTVLAITDERELVMIRQYRPAAGRRCLEFASGHVDEGEGPEQAARRELLEETGYVAGELVPLGSLRTDIGRMSNRVWSFCAIGARPAESAPEPEPGIERILCGSDAFREFVRTGQFDHSHYFATILLAQARGVFPGEFVLEVPTEPSR